MHSRKWGTRSFGSYRFIYNQVMNEGAVLRPAFNGILYSRKLNWPFANAIFRIDRRLWCEIFTLYTNVCIVHTHVLSRTFKLFTIRLEVVFLMCVLARVRREDVVFVEINEIYFYLLPTFIRRGQWKVWITSHKLIIRMRTLFHVGKFSTVPTLPWSVNYNTMTYYIDRFFFLSKKFTSKSTLRIFEYGFLKRF